MGGHKETRKSFGEVQADLQRQIVNNARSKLSSVSYILGMKVRVYMCVTAA